MPLARLSIVAAIHVGRHAVSLRRLRGPADEWMVYTRYPGTFVTTSPGLPKLEAKRVRRRSRIFVALCAAGVDEDMATQFAAKGAEQTTDWRKVVARYIEQYQLTR